MQIKFILGIMSTLAFFLPVLIVLIYKLYTNISFLALLIYYLNSGIYNLMSEGILKVPVDFARGFGTYCNYLDTVLILLVLLLFCIDKIKKNVVYTTLILYILYQVIIYLLFKFEVVSNVYSTGPGIIIILVFGVYLFYKHLRLALEQHKGIGKSLMIAAIVFAYGCYALIYVVHYLQKTTATDHVFIIYFIASIISAVLMSVGLIYLGKRYQLMRELKVTRRELAMFSDDKQTKRDMRFYE